MTKTLLGYADFTHVEGMTDYMNITINYVKQLGTGLDILDVPAGNGLVVDRLNELGHNAIGGDINDAREGFVRVNMEESFSFEDNSFDFIISITTLHNLYNYELKQAVQEIQRVGKGANKHIIIESYRNESEKVNLLYWQLTCECFYTPKEWEWFFAELCCVHAQSLKKTG